MLGSACAVGATITRTTTTTTTTATNTGDTDLVPPSLFTPHELLAFCPNAAMLSKNTKNVATPTSVSSRTERSGCVTCTLAATSCTQMDADIRCATRTNSERNAPSSEGGGALTTPSPSPRRPDHLAHTEATSRCVHESASGSADSTTVSDNTTPMSSDCCICTSSAAASSSRAMENDMDRVRSPPSEARACDTVTEPLMLRVVDVGVEELKRAAEEGFFVGTTTTDPMCKSVLTIRQLFLSDRAGGDEGPARKKKRPRAVYDHWRLSRGVICGAAFKSVLAHANVGPSQKEVRFVMRKIDDFLDPVRKALSGSQGIDRIVLGLGLGTRSLVGVQRRLLPECADSIGGRNYVDRNGLRDMAFGATVGLLCAFHIRADSPGANASTLADALVASCQTLMHSLARWIPSVCASHVKEKAHIAVERRCIERVIAALRVAADERPPSAEAYLRLQLEYARRAVWPSSIDCCGPDVHDELCRAILNGSLLHPVHEEPLITLAMPLHALSYSQTIVTTIATATSTPPPPLTSSESAAVPCERASAATDATLSVSGGASEWDAIPWDDALESECESVG